MRQGDPDTDLDTPTPGTGGSIGVLWERQQCGGVIPNKKNRVVHLLAISTLYSCPPKKNVFEGWGEETKITRKNLRNIQKVDGQVLETY